MPSIRSVRRRTWLPGIGSMAFSIPWIDASLRQILLVMRRSASLGEGFHVENEHKAKRTFYALAVYPDHWDYYHSSCPGICLSENLDDRTGKLEKIAERVAVADCDIRRHSTRAKFNSPGVVMAEVACLVWRIRCQAKSLHRDLREDVYCQVHPRKSLSLSQPAYHGKPGRIQTPRLGWGSGL